MPSFEDPCVFQSRKNKKKIKTKQKQKTKQYKKTKQKNAYLVSPPQKRYYSEINYFYFQNSHIKGLLPDFE